MKYKIIAISLMTIFAWINLQAQTERGRFIIRATSSIGASKTKGGLSTAPYKTSNTTIIIKPEVGYFLYDNFSVGVSFATKGSGSKLIDYPNSMIDTSVRVVEFYADLLSEFKYFFKGNNLRPYVKANAGYKYKDYAQVFGERAPVSEVHGLAFGGGIGGAFFVRKNISIDLELDYLHSNLKRLSPIFTTNGPIQEDNPLKNKMDEIKLFVGFSMYF